MSGYPVAVYVHVPFCASRCPYCDYAVTVGALDSASAFVDLTVQRIERQIDGVRGLAGLERASAVATIGYIGGGTPSLLPAEQLHRLVAGVTASCAEGSEVTVELNPEHVSPQLLELCSDAGATRVSLGIQAMQASLLHRIGRVADGARVARALSAIASWGGSTNVDVLAGVPGQTVSDLVETLRAAGDAADHVTLLELASDGDGAHSDDQELDLWMEGGAWLRAAGFEQYETVHFGRSGSRSAYVLHAATLQPLVAVGPGAEGLLGTAHPSRSYTVVRTRYPRSLCAYLYAARGGYHEEQVDVRTLAVHSLVGGLRLASGIKRTAWRRRFGDEAEGALDAIVGDWQRDGLAVGNEVGWRLTATGALRSDGLAADAAAALSCSLSLVWP